MWSAHNLKCSFSNHIPHTKPVFILWAVLELSLSELSCSIQKHRDAKEVGRCCKSLKMGSAESWELTMTITSLGTTVAVSPLQCKASWRGSRCTFFLVAAEKGKKMASSPVLRRLWHKEISSPSNYRKVFDVWWFIFWKWEYIQNSCFFWIVPN